MFSFLLIVFVFIVVAVIFAVALVGALIFRKKPAQPDQRIDHDDVIDVTAKDEK